MGIMKIIKYKEVKIMDTIIKTAKQYSYELDEVTLKELKFIAINIRMLKTMFIQDLVDLMVFSY